MKKLLELLKHNARLSNEQLAVMLDTTADDIAAKIAAYEQQGIIMGYSALINEEKLDRENVTAYIEVKVTPKPDRGFDELAATIKKYDEVDSVFLMSGGYDLAVTVKGNSLRDVALFVSERLSVLDGVISTATHFVLQRYKEKGIIFGGESHDERSLVSP